METLFWVWLEIIWEMAWASWWPDKRWIKITGIIIWVGTQVVIDGIREGWI
jgi:hypothetical protein